MSKEFIILQDHYSFIEINYLYNLNMYTIILGVITSKIDDFNYSYYI